MYQIIVNGEAWIDSDGVSEWKLYHALALESLILDQGYESVEVVPV